MGERLQLRIRPDWDAVKGAWDPSMEMFVSAGFNRDTAYSLCMTGQELLENAVKYGKFKNGDEITLEVELGKNAVTIEVRNPVDEDADRLKRLDDTIQWIRGYQNPFEAYVEKMKEVSSQPYTPGQSGLGLTRIAYEGQCILDFYVDDRNTLAVSAVYLRGNTSST
jgi:hypothetical protein